MTGRGDKHQPVLAVDLDGTLIHTDLLHETFWCAFTRRWSTPIDALLQLPFGRAQLKRRLANLSSIDVTLLPYNEEAIAYIRRWRDEGGRALLVTAADQTLAERVAHHVGLFDEVHGSDGRTNFNADHKATFLVDKFGDAGFAYMGDAEADLAVWRRAAKAVTVSASNSLKERVNRIGREADHLVNNTKERIEYLKALRPHQWVKNVLIFLPMLAAHQLLPETFFPTVLAFTAFCLVASSVYVVNDLLDLAADRAHPRKRYRPLASGAVSITHGTWLAPLLFAAGMMVAALLGWKFILLALGYYIATTAYSLYLKRRLIIDIFVLAGLYTVRIIAGGVATDIPLSVWLLAFSMFFFFSLAAIKRQAELVDGVASGEVSARGRGYHVDDLQLVATMASASGYVSVLVLALYVSSPAVTTLYTQPAALWGICLVIFYWISRMVFITHRGGMHDDPIVFAVKDRVSIACAVAIVAFAVGGTLL